MSRVHSVNTIIPVPGDQDCPAVFFSLTTTVILGETPEKGCWAKYSVDAQFSYNIPFTSWTKSLEVTFPSWCQIGLPKRGTLLRIEGRKKVEAVMLLVGASVRVSRTPEIAGMRAPDFIPINDGVSYRNVSIKGGLMDFG